MNQPLRYHLVILGFVGYWLFLSFKDVLFRFVLHKGGTIGDLLFTSGSTCLLTAILFNVLFHKGSFIPANTQRQILRVFVNGSVWFFTAKAFQLLNATSISIVSKIYSPLLILLGPLTGVFYKKSQKLYSILVIISMLVFMYLSKGEGDDLIGYSYLFLAVGILIIDYILLRDSALNESPFVVAAVPAVACIAFGSYLKLYTNSGFIFGGDFFWFGVLTGVIIYGIYFFSIYRYKLLPLGISEYPAVLTPLIILPSEYLLFGFIPTSSYVISLLISMVLLGYVMHLNRTR